MRDFTAFADYFRVNFFDSAALPLPQPVRGSTSIAAASGVVELFRGRSNVSIYELALDRHGNAARPPLKGWRQTASRYKRSKNTNLRAVDDYVARMSFHGRFPEAYVTVTADIFEVPASHPLNRGGSDELALLIEARGSPSPIEPPQLLDHFGRRIPRSLGASSGLAHLVARHGGQSFLRTRKNL